MQSVLGRKHNPSECHCHAHASPLPTLAADTMLKFGAISCFAASPACTMCMNDHSGEAAGSKRAQGSHILTCRPVSQRCRHHADSLAADQAQEISWHGSSTRNPNKCTPYLRVISTKIEIFSSYTVLTPENSTTLSLGRRPLSKSVEFSDVRTL
jgi:hypothetical protein